MIQHSYPHAQNALELGQSSNSFPGPQTKRHYDVAIGNALLKCLFSVARTT